MKQSSEVRQTFIDYFSKQGHQPVTSSRLIPENDPTLLFTNAGMNQFKNVFLGHEQREIPRAVSAQKCVRAGGKHNDLENVGLTARHHTFFEMMGNFSFGDYFKKEAIHMAWELITKEYGIDKKRLYVSVFKDDNEAADIWHNQEGVPRDRIYRFGEKDNFWRMGDSGPCGPCSEIFYDLGPEIGGDPKENVMGGNGDRFMEFWNLVFMQYYEDGVGGRTALPKPSVDTGLGLERTTNILQGQINNYDTDLFQDIIQAACRQAQCQYLKSSPVSKLTGEQERVNVALRVLADHSRAAAFLLADGVLPSNEGRGYVLRRILRRAIRFGNQLSQEKSLLPTTVNAVIQKMSGFYPELNQQKNLIERTVVDEEKRFLATLEQGTHLLTQELERLPAGGTLSGEVLFKLYDTFGFPADLTRLMVQEKGFKTDELGFEQRLGLAKEKARSSWKGKALTGNDAHLLQWTQKLNSVHGETLFSGYETTQESGVQLLALSSGESAVTELNLEQVGLVVVNKSCFYPESGGQVGDRGVIRSPSGEAEVLDCSKKNGVILHHVKVTDGKLKPGEPVQLVVRSLERRSIANNHSATHLLHAALRQVLGTHVQQAGSLVESERLRFDFTHNQPLSPTEIEQVENLVLAEIGKGIQVQAESMSHQAAMDKGAMALFGEKYGNEVRVIQMGEFSMELCGGIHVSNTSQIRFFKIVSETGVSAGIRRIEAITGERAADYLTNLAREALSARAQAGLTVNWQKYLAEPVTKLKEWIDETQSGAKALQRQIQALKGKNVDIDSLVESAQKFSKGASSGSYIFAEVPMDDRKVLSDLSDRLQDRLKDGVVVIIGQGESTHPVIVSVSKNLVSHFNAGKILNELAQTLGGKGGGRPDFAQGAVPSRENLPSAQQRLKALLS